MVGLGEVVLEVWPSVQLVETGLLEGITVEDSLQATRTVVREVRVIVVVWIWSFSPQAREKRLPYAISVKMIGLFIFSSLSHLMP